MAARHEDDNQPESVGATPREDEVRWEDGEDEATEGPEAFEPQELHEHNQYDVYGAFEEVEPEPDLEDEQVLDPEPDLEDEQVLDPEPDLEDEQVLESESDAVADGSEPSAAGRAPVFLAGLVVGALVLGMVWLAQAQLAPPEPAASRDAPAASSQIRLPQQDQDQAAAAAAQAPSKLSDCSAAYAAQHAALRAVGPALSQWEVHIGAMNKLVVGAISLEQAAAFWNDTRVGAHRNLTRFERALRAYDDRTPRCPAKTGSAAGASHELHTCVRAVTARDAALRRARTTLATWRIHVAHMEMLRRGEMTPAEASAAWLRSWRQGSREVREYHDAAARADAASGRPGVCRGSSD